MMRSIRAIAAGAALALCISATATAGPLEDAAAAFYRGDYVVAAQLIRPLADQGDAVAQVRLGNLYENGLGVPQNYAEAARWFRKAADQGLAVAQSSLGMLYANGQGVAQDYAEAARWFRKAADQGDASAQYNLGVLYSYGQGIPQDQVLAYQWLNLAAAHPPAEDSDSFVTQRDVVAAQLTPAQLAEGQRLAREWRPK